MKSRTQPHNINWLIHESFNQSSTIGSNHKFSKVAFPYDAKMASGFTQHFDGLDGIVLIQDRHHFIKDECPSTIPIGKFSVKFDAPMFVLHIMHSGSIDVYSHHHCIKTFREKGFILCARPWIRSWTSRLYQWKYHHYNLNYSRAYNQRIFR